MTTVSGQSLTHYRLIEKIGEGGMGVVWKAVDTRLDREVALKLLPEHLERDMDWLARLAREARAVAALNHPNIVTIHSLEEDAGRRFLVMELVEGPTLGDIIEESGRLPVEHLLNLAVQMVDAVRAAHERGVIHRDLKPGNLMVGDDSRIKVLDFGMAKPAHPRKVSATTTTEESILEDGGLTGTLPYMSPEQVRSEPIDHRSDVFSMGVVLYEMATGQRPFKGGGPAELVASILRDSPRPPTKERDDLPQDLERIILRALEKDADRRFQTALEMRNELEQLQEDLSRGLPAEKKRRRPAESEVRSVAVLPLDDLWGDPEQAYFADGMTDALISSLAPIGALKVISRTSVMQYKGTKKSIPEVARELGVDAIVEGSVLRAGSRVRITAQLIDAARDRLLWGESYEHDLSDVLALQSRVARAIAEHIAIELTPQEDAHLSRAMPIDPRVHEACLKGRHFWYKRTTETVQKGLKCFEEALRLEPGHAPAWAGVADSYIVDGGRYLGVSPKVAYARAREAAERAVELDDRLAEAHTSLAAVMTDYDWDWAGADREYRRALELNPNYVTAHSWYAEQLSRMGRHDDAVGEARKASELDPLSLASQMIVAWILYFARRYDEAIAQGLKTLELDPSYATTLRILGWAYEETGR
jgi:serine/threonine-protein kinase